MGRRVPVRGMVHFHAMKNPTRLACIAHKPHRICERCRLGNDLNEQLTQNQLRFELSRNELNICFQAGLKGLDKFCQLKAMRLARSQSQCVRINSTILPPR